MWQVIASRHMPKVTGALEKDCLELACLKLTSTEAFVRCWLEWEDKRSRSGRASIVLSRTPTYQPTNNLLYRVEVVEGGNEDSARFVWSRNNGCAQFRVLGQSGNTVTVGAAGGLVGAKPQKGQIVELLGPVPYAPGDARTTAAVDDVKAAERVAGRQPAEPASWKLTLDADLPGLGLGGDSRDVLRLWDGRFGAAEAATEQGRLLDDDVWVRVPNSQSDLYTAGDHWLLTTRGIGNLDVDAQPRVVEDYVAPLALVLRSDADDAPTTRDLRSTFYPSAMWTVWDRSARKSHEDVDDDRHDDD